MRIGIDIRCLAEAERTGIGEYTTELLQAIFRQPSSHHYYLFSNGYHLTAPHLETDQANVEYVSTSWPNKLLNAGMLLCGRPRLDQLITDNKKIQLDAFFSPTLNFTALSPTLPQLLTIHDISFAFFPDFFSAKQRLWHRLLNTKQQCQQARHIITPSANTKRDLVEHFQLDPQKITVIYSGLNSTLSPATSEEAHRVQKKYNLSADYLLFLGTIEPRKNIEAVIKAFEQSFTSLPKPYQLVMAGAAGWNNDAVYQAIRNSPLKERISVIGYVTPEDKAALYQGAAVFLYPSFYEGFGFPVLEAMSLGVPVITSNRSSLSEVTGDAAYLVNPHHPEEISLGLQRLLRSPELKKTFQTKGLVQAKRFSWNQAAIEWLQLVDHLKN